MATSTTHFINVQGALLEAIRSLPLERAVTHCGQTWMVSPFDLHSTCAACSVRIKLRAFSAVPEVEDLFDAVFEWMNLPGGEALADRRRKEIAEDEP